MTCRRPSRYPIGSRREPYPESFTRQVESLEKDLISDALKRSSGSFAGAARELGITSRILRYKARKLGLRGA